MTKSEAIAELKRLREPSAFRAFEVVRKDGNRFNVMNVNWFGLNHRTLVLIDESKGGSQRIPLSDIVEINVLQTVN